MIDLKYKKKYDIVFKYTQLDLFMSCPRQALIYKEISTSLNLKGKKPRQNPFNKAHFRQSLKNEKIVISNKKNENIARIKKIEMKKWLT